MILTIIPEPQAMTILKFGVCWPSNRAINGYITDANRDRFDIPREETAYRVSEIVCVD